ncbi:aspartate dehydrogenase [Leisingera sp.]|uniref:aspartate dehydrogenase n=1 Tax=Leisingera sp. TaxID=1879318 RepID=UPI002B269231|nr:aspartate dehydrogenase [Leisingera sp.]
MDLALIGFGNIATTLLSLLNDTLDAPLDSLTVMVLPEFAEDTEARLEHDFAGLAADRQVVTSVPALLEARPDLLIECAGHAVVKAHLPEVLRSGVDTILVSIGALADDRLHADLRAAAREGDARLILPAGAVGGIDLLSALGAAGGLEVTYRGIKPPKAWTGTPAEESLDLDHLGERAIFFTGNAREAATAYPKNANVAATLALAGAGFEATRVELVADPAASGNMHEYEVSSPLARYSMRIENLPSAGNAKTSVSTVYSVLREIRNRIGPSAI